MKIFFDTEFTGLKQDTTLMTIGFIDENGRTIYAENTEFNKDKKELEPFIKDHVLPYTFHIGGSKISPDVKIGDFGNTIVDTKERLSIRLKSWLKVYEDEEIQFVSDVAHYDFVLLIDLLYGHALNVPSNVSAVCHDINQDIAREFNISDKEAFNKEREEIIKEELKDIKILKHNALFDAKVIRLIYNKLNRGE